MKIKKNNMFLGREREKINIINCLKAKGGKETTLCVFVYGFIMLAPFSIKHSFIVLQLRVFVYMIFVYSRVISFSPRVGEKNLCACVNREQEEEAVEKQKQFC